MAKHRTRRAGTDDETDETPETETEVVVDPADEKVAAALEHVELDEDESKAALDAALAAKRKEVEATTREAHAEEEDAKLRDPEAYLVIDNGGGGSVIPVPKDWKRDRSITVHKQNYEHVSEDSYGRWVYRAM